jgi:hypothetical protein
MRVSVIERGFQLARTGSFATSRDIDKVLRQEGYTHADVASLTFPSVRRQLLKACQEARQQK